MAQKSVAVSHSRQIGNKSRPAAFICSTALVLPCRRAETFAVAQAAGHTRITGREQTFVLVEVALAPLIQGYAEVGSDSGHQGDGMSASFIVNDQLAAKLFGSLSVPTVMSAAVKIRSRYVSTPK